LSAWPANLTRAEARYRIVRRGFNLWCPVLGNSASVRSPRLRAREREAVATHVGIRPIRWTTLTREAHSRRERTFDDFQTGRGEGTVADAMSEPLRLTIVYEDAGEGDGWVVARIPQVRGAISQGATREEARQNVIDALRELLAARFGSPPELPDRTDSDSLELTIAA
jgi:predicted RNase H-like HicB family nuclease